MLNKFGWSTRRVVLMVGIRCRSICGWSALGGNESYPAYFSHLAVLPTVLLLRMGMLACQMFLVLVLRPEQTSLS